MAFSILALFFSIILAKVIVALAKIQSKLFLYSLILMLISFSLFILNKLGYPIYTLNYGGIPKKINTEYVLTICFASLLLSFFLLFLSLPELKRNLQVKKSKESE